MQSGAGRFERVVLQDWPDTTWQPYWWLDFATPTGVPVAVPLRDGSAPTADLFGDPRRVVAQTTLKRKRRPPVLVSTVFLIVDHNHRGVGPPVLWETMAFWLPDRWEFCERYSSWLCAEEGHRRIVYEVARLLGVQPPKRRAALGYTRAVRA
jgi:hypothetical protein